jgi:hypothetical protein
VTDELSLSNSENRPLGEGSNLQRLRLKHQLFAIHYLACGLNGAQAARSAG